MRLDFELLELRDFKAFRGAHKFRLDLPGVTHIVGDNRVNPDLYGNGVSKSTIWDALLWCLYGCTARGMRNNDVAPWSGGKPYVATTLSVDGSRHVIERRTSPNRFTCDGDDIPDIGAVFDLGFELAVNTIILPQGRELFLQRKPTDKMKLFSEAMPLEKWDLRSAAAGKATTTLEQEVVAIQSDIERGEGVLQELDRNLAETRRRAGEWQDAERKRVRVSQKQVETLKRDRDRLDRELSGAVLAEDSALTELKACEDSARKLQFALTSATAAVASLREGIADQRAQKILLAGSVNNKTPNCPTCGQSLKGGSLEKHRDHLEARRVEIDENIKRFLAREQGLVALIAEKKLAIAQAEKSADEFDKKARTAGDVILRRRPEVATLNRQIEEALKPSEDVNPYTQQVADITTRRKKLVITQEKFESQLLDAKAEAERHKFWVKGFKDIKLQLIEDVLSELELVANGMIDEVGLDGWRIKFDIEREAKNGNIQNMINVEVMSPESKEKIVKWDSFSGGELQRLRLVGSLALADVLLSHAGIETNLEVLDEPAVYWAGEGVQELVAYLATRARERDKSIYFIEHSAIESLHFSRVWNIVKDKSGARLATNENGVHTSIDRARRAMGGITSRANE